MVDLRIISRCSTFVKFGHMVCLLFKQLDIDPRCPFSGNKNGGDIFVRSKKVSLHTIFMIRANSCHISS